MNAGISRNPVLLIHGIDDTIALFYRMTAFLQSKGWAVHSIDLTPNNGDEGLDKLAYQIDNYAKQTFAPDQPFDLIAFSMGGIVSRYYVQRLGGIQRVQRFITIASPHKGTLTGYLRPNTGCNQMCRGSQFLRNLNHDAAMLERINFTSIWSPLDLMIVPASSSQLGIGKEIIIPVILHPLMVTDSRVLSAISKALIEPLRNPPRKATHS